MYPCCCVSLSPEAGLRVYIDPSIFDLIQRTGGQSTACAHKRQFSAQTPGPEYERGREHNSHGFLFPDLGKRVGLAGAYSPRQTGEGQGIARHVDPAVAV